MPLLARSLAALVALISTTACVGDPGPPGEDGAPGTPGEDGSPGDPAQRAVYRAEFSSDEDADSGLVPNRTLTFGKTADETGIRVTYYDHHGAQSGTMDPPCVCVWEVLFDGESCFTPGRVEGFVGSIAEQTFVSQTISGYCEATTSGLIPSGDVALSVSVTPSGTCDCVTGFSGLIGFLEAEELE